MSGDSPKSLSTGGSGFKISIAAARFNKRLVDSLLDGVLKGLLAAGVKSRNISIVRVPGSNELPVAARLLVDRKKPDVVIALGVIIRGGTLHYELISTAATNSLQDVALATRIPVINGIIVAENIAQARARCQGKINRGAEFARAAVEMAALRRSLAK